MWCLYHALIGWAVRFASGSLGLRELLASLLNRSRERVVPVGDKSPKSKEKAKKQDDKDKQQKKDAAAEKAKPKDPNAKKK